MKEDDRRILQEVDAEIEAENRPLRDLGPCLDCGSIFFNACNVTPEGKAHQCDDCCFYDPRINCLLMRMH